MAFDPNPNKGPIRDRTNVSEIAGDRPALVTRIHCVEDTEEMSPENTLRGSGEDQVARMNKRLREG